MTKYVKVDWPESQKFMEYEDETYVCAESAGTLFVPEELYNDVTYKLQFPKKYENTNLGTIVCYETRAIVNGEDIYWYDLKLLKRGSKILAYKHDSKEWIITTCIANGMNLPILLEDKNWIPGLNCDIIGVKNS